MVLLLFTKGEGPEGSNLRNRAIINLRVPGGATQGVGIDFREHGGKQAAIGGTNLHTVKVLMYKNT